MAKAAFVPSFTAPKKVDAAFVTNNPMGQDNMSAEVLITELNFNEVTRSIEVKCSDRRMRQCRIDRFKDDAMVRTLCKKLQKALDDRMLVQFVAAGGNDANVWFYNVVAVK